jgi:flagellar biosynthesis GTPase FlhF
VYLTGSNIKSYYIFYHILSYQFSIASFYFLFFYLFYFILFGILFLFLFLVGPSSFVFPVEGMSGLNRSLDDIHDKFREAADELNGNSYSNSRSAYYHEHDEDVEEMYSMHHEDLIADIDNDINNVNKNGDEYIHAFNLPTELSSLQQSSSNRSNVTSSSNKNKLIQTLADVPYWIKDVKSSTRWGSVVGDKRKQAEAERQNMLRIKRQRDVRNLTDNTSQSSPNNIFVGSESSTQNVDDEGVCQHRSYVFKRAPIHGDYVSVTSMNGTRMYLAMQTIESMEDKAHRQHRSIRRDEQQRLQLLGNNIHDILLSLDEAESQADIDRRMTEQLPQQLSSSLVSDVDKQIKVGDKSSLDASRDGPVHPDKVWSNMKKSLPSQRKSGLWVDKYSPQGYAELLSPESINRPVLQWLKQWDKKVFKKKGQPSTRSNLTNEDGRLGNKPKLEEDKNHESVNKALNSGAFFKKDVSTNAGSAVGEAEDGRLERKLLLLCGPPGLGKTTLAHVLAKHCGYHVRTKMNCSLIIR